MRFTIPIGLRVKRSSRRFHVPPHHVQSKTKAQTKRPRKPQPQGSVVIAGKVYAASTKRGAA
jgi:hypothetical protein